LAFLIAPLQVARIKYGSVTSIPANDLGIQMALDFLPSLVKMLSPNGAVFYAPNNTLNGGRDMGKDVSTENNVSLLAGLKMLRYILSTNGYHLDRLGDVNNLITRIENYVRLSYDPLGNYFRQGGTYDRAGYFIWAEVTPFSVDCQTWAMSIVNPLLIDQWFGPGTAQNIWKTTKKMGGFNCIHSNGYCDGLGFTSNEDQVFSGEWSLGAINMLRIFANEYNDLSFRTEAQFMRDAIEAQLLGTATINGHPVTGVKYSNKRYYIPFGWWANPLLSTASAGWAVLADNDYNPFYLGGAYKVNY